MQVSIFVHSTACNPSQQHRSSKNFIEPHQLANTTPHSSNYLQLMQASDYLQKNMDKKISLHELALRFGSNRSKLSCEFKRIFFCGVFVWLRERRMEKARELLVTTNLSVMQISMTVGYDNAANFATSYKAFFNISPRNQRNLRGAHISTSTTTNIF